MIQPYSLEAVKKVIQLCDHDYEDGAKFLGSRNRAIVLMLLDSGLRLSELTNIRMQDVDAEKGWIKVLGKGGKERIVRIGKVAQKALWRYLMYRGDSNYREIWLSEEKRPLRRAGIQSTIQSLKKRTGIDESGPVHRFRHTFALNFLRADRNPFNLQYLLGHSSLEMVKRYTATMGMEDALKAHEAASPADLLGLK